MNVPPIIGGDPPRKGGGDPFIAYGPNGALYAGQEPSAVRERPGFPYNLPDSDIAIVYSGDHGKTWGPPQIATTPADRPWITADLTTGTLYSVSSGHMNFTTKTHNVPGDGAINDRWLVAWKPGLAGKSEPRRLGGPDFAGTAGSTIAAAHGVVAATFVLGPPSFFMGPANQRPAESSAIPASLRDLVKDGATECTPVAPCLFFETSTDEGVHWTRHHVPVPGGFSAQRVNVAADPGRPGRYAVGMLSVQRTGILVMVTDDSGATWSGPHAIPETAEGVNFKQWMAYGPTGVLGFVWKKQREDLTPATARSATSGPGSERGDQPAFDVYVSIACDGGRTWNAPVRVNAVTSLPGVSRTDDLSYIALDSKNAHMVWGDRRIYPKVANVPGGTGGTHSFYGRAPFSLITKGAPCGR